MYVVINFFVFLFYVPMIDHNLALAINIWNVHNVAYIIFCLFITRALYATTGN
jgi:quinol-cytochrome oxidoreductase complex cytochrome b subunit